VDGVSIELQHGLDKVIHFILFKLLQNRGRMDRYELELRLVKANELGLTHKQARHILNYLEELGLIAIERSYSEEYKACVERAKADKRIKDVEKHCAKKHPSRSTIYITKDLGVSWYVNSYIKKCVELGNNNMDCHEDALRWLCDKLNANDCHRVHEVVLCRSNKYRYYNEVVAKACAEVDR